MSISHIAGFTGHAQHLLYAINGHPYLAQINLEILRLHDGYHDPLLGVVGSVGIQPPDDERITFLQAAAFGHPYANEHRNISALIASESTTGEIKYGLPGNNPFHYHWANSTVGIDGSLRNQHRYCAPFINECRYWRRRCAVGIFQCDGVQWIIIRMPVRTTGNLRINHHLQGVLLHTLIHPGHKNDQEKRYSGDKDIEPGTQTGTNQVFISEFQCEHHISSTCHYMTGLGTIGGRLSENSNLQPYSVERLTFSAKPWKTVIRGYQRQTRWCR